MDGQIPPDLGKHLAGPIGSFVALIWIQGTKLKKLGMLAAGIALSYYGSTSVAQWLEMSEGFTGFLLGLFGMSIVDKLFDAWHTLEIGTLLRDWIRKLLGLGDAK